MPYKRILLLPASRRHSSVNTARQSADVRPSPALSVNEQLHDIESLQQLQHAVSETTPAGSDSQPLQPPGLHTHELTLLCTPADATRNCVRNGVAHLSAPRPAPSGTSLHSHSPIHKVSPSTTLAVPSNTLLP